MSGHAKMQQVPSYFFNFFNSLNSLNSFLNTGLLEHLLVIFKYFHDKARDRGGAETVIQEQHHPSSNRNMTNCIFVHSHSTKTIPVCRNKKGS